MTAADVQAIAESVIAISAAGAVVAWALRTHRKIGSWRKRRRRDAVLNAPLSRLLRDTTAGHRSHPPGQGGVMSGVAPQSGSDEEVAC